MPKKTIPVNEETSSQADVDVKIKKVFKQLDEWFSSPQYLAIQAEMEASKGAVHLDDLALRDLVCLEMDIASRPDHPGAARAKELCAIVRETPNKQKAGHWLRRALMAFPDATLFDEKRKAVAATGGFGKGKKYAETDREYRQHLDTVADLRPKDRRQSLTQKFGILGPAAFDIHRRWDENRKRNTDAK